MNTLALIDAVTTAQADYDAAQSTLSTATQAMQTAASALQAAKQALHDDLAANGPALYHDEVDDEYFIYTAADPDSFTATPIRVAA